MRNVRFDPAVIKELRRLIRDSSKGVEVQAALKKIYTTGYDNGQAEATKRIKEVLSANNQSLDLSHDVDGEQLQSIGGIIRVSEGVATNDPHSRETGTDGQWKSEPLSPRPV